MLSKILVACIVTVFTSHGTSAQGITGDAIAGHALALKSCAECHVVDDMTQTRGSDAVPSFAAIAGNKKLTVGTLRTFLQAPHGRMPDFILSREEIDNVVAYIVSVKGQ